MTEQDLDSLKTSYDGQQQTTYITLEELKERQAEKRRIDLARQQAHEACILLRKQLAQLEMDRKFLQEEVRSNGIVPHIFSNSTEYKDFKNKMWWSNSK